MATMTLSPTSAAPGAAITVTGSGFANNAKMKVAVESVPLLSFKASNNGSFTKTIYAPSGANRNVAVVATSFVGHSWVVGATATLAIVNVGPPVDTTKPVISAVASGSITQTSATVTWTTNEPATTQVEYGPVPNLGSVTAKVSTLVTSHSQVLTGLTPGVTYRYRVWSADAANNVQWSEAGAPFTTSAPSPTYTVPGAPASLTATAGNGLVNLAWTAPVSNGGTAITNYRIYRNSTSLITLGNVLTYQDIGLVNNQAYQYQVTAINAVGEGPPSILRSATPGDTTPPTISGIAHGSITQTTATVSWSINEPATGQVEYGPTTSYGSTTILEPGFLLAHAQPLTGLTAGTLYHYRAKSLDAAGNPGYSNDRTFTTVVLAPPPASVIYGPGISGDGLGNTRFQGSLRIQSCRFRAEQSSALSAFTFYYLGPPDPGYALGTGGTWKAEVFADDDGTWHYPTGSPLCTQNVAALGGSDADRVITFASPATLVAGRLYHLVFTLTDASPDANHFSTDHWFTRQVPTGAPDGRIVPRFPLTDWAHLYYEHPSGPWITRSQYTPILDLAYVNGQHQGMSYGEAQYGPNDVGEITGTSKMVRERFTVSGGNRQVTGAGIRLLREYGTDPLTVRLEDNAGTLIDSFTIAASLIPTGPAPTGANNSDNDLGVNAKWQAGAFATVRTLMSGTTYRLRLSTAAGSKYWAWTNRRLSQSYPNYTAATAFQDGYAEVTTNGSTWSALGVDVNQYDLQFYLTGAVVSSMPTTNLPGWQLIFTDDFLTPVSEGQFPAAVSAKWGAYPSPWDDTSNHGIYSPEIASIHDSLLDIHVRTVAGVHKVCAPYPKINGVAGPFGYSVGNDQLYGRYAVRFRIDAIDGYKTAWLLWPRSETWPQDGEIDFPEGDLVSTISAFMHRQNGVNGADQDGYSTSAVYPTWHTAVIEWAPNRCEFFLDGVSIGAATSRVPNTPMHWVLQTETELDGSIPADAAQGHVLIDWVAVWAYAP